MLEHLVEDLRRRQCGPQLLGNRGDRRLEHFLAPPGRGDRLADRPLLTPHERLAEARDVVQHSPRLVLLRIEPGEPEQPVPVVPGLHDVRVEPQPVPVRCRLELDLLDVEPEVVQSSAAARRA